MSTLVVWDDDLVEHEHDGASVGDALDRLRDLNGQTRSLVTIFVGEGHLAAGGSASEGIVLYVTFDGSSFHQLSRGGSEDEPVQVVAGGQAAAYESRLVVELALAELAVQAFMEDGALASNLDWVSS